MRRALANLLFFGFHVDFVFGAGRAAEAKEALLQYRSRLYNQIEGISTASMAPT